MTPARFPHSDTPGSTLGCQLPRAYRRLLRPSSALDAKASTMCPSQLVTHTTNPTPAQPGPGSRCTLMTHHKEPTHPHNHNQGCEPGACLQTRDTPTPPPPTQFTGVYESMHLKMLASTIQISNNNPTPRHRHPFTGAGTRAGQPTPHPKGGPAGTEAPDSRLTPQNPNSVLID